MPRERISGVEADMREMMGWPSVLDQDTVDALKRNGKPNKKEKRPVVSPLPQGTEKRKK